MDEAGRTTHRSSGRGLAWAAAWGLVAAGCAAWAGCSVEKHYKVLSFFFDGVPDPNAPRRTMTGGSTAATALRDSPSYSVHPPFAEEKCGDCHVSRFRQEALEATVCLKCHEKTPSEHAHMHGPVATLACLWCHVPHESAFAHLFKDEARAVCTQCHEPALLNTERVPAHAEAARSCLECHSGHGGPRPFFLTPTAEGALAAPGPVAPPGGR